MVRPQAAGTAGMSGGKNPVRFIVQKGRPHQFDFTGPVELVEEDNMGKGFNIFQSLRIL